MTHGIPTFIIVLSIALASWFSRYFVEVPTYPVSQSFHYLIFLCGVTAAICLNLAASRKSFFHEILAAQFSSLFLTLGLFADLCFRWPDALLLTLALGAVLTHLARSLKFGNSLVLLRLAIAAAISLIPLVVIIYKPWPQITRPLVGLISFTSVIAAGYMAGRNQSRSGGTTGWFYILTLVTLPVALLILSMFPGYNTPANRVSIEEALFAMLLLGSAVYVADKFRAERSLRAGPHVELDPSMKDPLTGIANRRAMDTHGPVLVSQSYGAGRPVSVIACDIDHFKQINDTHGHQAGDAALRQVASILASQVRQSDLVIRYGGEEFTIILSASALAPAMRLAERMRQSIEQQRVIHENRNFKVTASFGIATAFPENPVGLTELIKQADNNLYTAKHDGRNCVRAEDIVPLAF